MCRGALLVAQSVAWLERIREQCRAEGRAEARKVIQRALAKARESDDTSRIEAYEELLRTFDGNGNLPSNQPLDNSRSARHGLLKPRSRR